MTYERCPICESIVDPTEHACLGPIPADVSEEPAPARTNADRAAALRALSRSTHDPLLAFALDMRAEFVVRLTGPSSVEVNETARRSSLDDALRSFEEIAVKNRDAERNARERAETAEAALAVLREVVV